MRKIIIDTDIGGDIDDIWALILMLSTNLFDVKLISVTNGDIDYQVKIVAKILYLLNKQHIPIAKGISNNNENIYPQLKWVEDFDLENYSGRIYESYQEAYKEVLNKESEAALVGLAPLTSLVTVVPLLQKYNIKTILMAGSINVGYFDSDTPDAECNIVSDLEAARQFLSSNLDLTLAPLDVCNKIIINKDNYKNIRSSITQHSKIICENYSLWQEEYVGGAKKFDIENSSSILYDLAPVLYLLFPQNFEVVEKRIYVDDFGITKIGKGQKIKVALKVHKLNVMLQFVSEQYCTNFENNKEIRQLQIEGKYSLTYALQKCNETLSVIEYGWEKKPPGSAFGPAERDYYILHFITQGKGKLIVEDLEFNVNKGDCFLIPPKLTTYYVADKKDPYTYYWVGFDGLEARSLLEKTGLITNNNYVIHPKEYATVFKKFLNIQVTSDKKHVAPYQLVGNLYLLLSEIINSELINVSNSEDYIDQAVRYMNLNYDKNITIDSIAKIIGLERTHFYRIFKDVMKISPKYYLINLRLEKAKVLLCNTTMSISEVAYSVGYDNYMSFEKIFKDIVGVTPSIYRRKNT